MLSSSRYLQSAALPQLYKPLPTLRVRQESPDRFKLLANDEEIWGQVVRHENGRWWKAFDGHGNVVGTRFHNVGNAANSLISTVVNRWIAEVCGEIDVKQQALAR